MPLSRQPRTYYSSGITRFDESRRRPRVSRLLALCLALLLLVWGGIPALRVAEILAPNPFRHGPSRPSGLPVTSIHFAASDGVPLAGWFVERSAQAPSVILVPGFKADRASMVPYARFLYADGLNVLLYDSRGTGGSGGMFSLGVREVNDVHGAITFLEHRSSLRNQRIGVLGVSLGAGVAIVAASRFTPIKAVVADSAYTDQRAVVDRLDTLRVGPLRVPLAPIAPWIVDRILGTRLAAFSPLQVVAHIAPRALLLIHSRHDTNPTTPLSGAIALYRAAGPPVSLWVAPHGDHAGAVSAQPAAYRRHVDHFFARYLR